MLHLADHKQYSARALVVDLNGDGRAQPDEHFQHGQRIAGAGLQLVSISPTGDRIVLTPEQGSAP